MPQDDMWEWLTVPGRTFAVGGKTYAVVPDDIPDLLLQIAEARGDYVHGDPYSMDSMIISHEISVLIAVAEAVRSGDWTDLIAGMAPSWRWHQFGDQDPTPRRGDAEEDQAAP